MITVIFKDLLMTIIRPKKSVYLSQKIKMVLSLSEANLKGLSHSPIPSFIGLYYIQSSALLVGRKRWKIFVNYSAIQSQREMIWLKLSEILFAIAVLVI